MDFLEELRWRGLIHQVTDMEVAKAALAEAGCAVYIGFDPTADSLHVGSLLQLTLLARLARAGHRPIALIGGGTGMIGDPSGKSAERRLQSPAELRANAAAIRDQILAIWQHLAVTDAGVLPLEVVDNALWLEQLHVIAFLRDVGKHFSVNAMVQRDSVRSRLEAREQGLSYTEFSYMLLQAYDFLELYRRHACRAQMGGSDQWGNIVSGTDLIGRLEASAATAPAFGITVPLITSRSGQKFGKTEEGTIWLDRRRTSPYQFYQFWMNVEDADAEQYLKFFTFLSAADLSKAGQAGEHPRQAQGLLASELTALVHGPAARDAVLHAATLLFGGGEPTLAPLATFAEVLAEEIPTAAAPPEATILALLVGENRPFPSNGEAKRALQAGSVALNGRKVALAEMHAAPGRLHDRYVLIRHGKKSYFLADFGA